MEEQRAVVGINARKGDLAVHLSSSKGEENKVVEERSRSVRWYGVIVRRHSRMW